MPVSEHFNEVLKLGVDLGAEGGHGWQTDVVQFPNGISVRNQARSHALGRWQLGNRRVDVAEFAKLRDFFHAMRGQLHTWLYLDWLDYRAEQEPLVLDGSSTTQLIKTYGLSINPWVRVISRPNVASLVIELDDGGGWAELEAGADFTVDASTGVITWVMPPPAPPDAVRWSGEFYVRARFDRDELNAQFIAHDEVAREGLYELGQLGVIEEPE